VGTRFDSCGTPVSVSGMPGAQKPAGPYVINWLGVG
jgi:hypothetical protein